MSHGGWAPYVPVAQRRANAMRQVDKLRKKGQKIEPVNIQGRVIAKSFWGKAWCGHMEQLGDYANRLPRGRTYARNGSVCHLEIKPGAVEAIVSGSQLYNIKIAIKPLTKTKWQNIQKACSSEIGSMLALLQGEFSDEVMNIVSDEKNGLFPLPNEIQLDCDCPDWAGLCKHLAAVLYGVGARLDQQPELLFLLRAVDHRQLINTQLNIPTKTGSRLVEGDLADLFGIELDDTPAPVKYTAVKTKAKAKRIKPSKAAKKVPAKKLPAKKVPAKVSNIRPSAASVLRLRKRFSMNHGQFSQLLGVSVTAVVNWEAKQGRLTLRPGSLEAIKSVVNLTREQAWQQLSEGT